MKAFEKKLQKKLISSKRRTILIVEDDKDFCRDMAEFWNRKGYQVFIESKVSDAKRRLSVLHATSTKVDLAYVRENKETGSLSYSAFLNVLRATYPGLKQIVVADDAAEKVKPTEAAVMERKDDLKALGDVTSDSFDYSQESFKEHFERVREFERQARKAAILNKKPTKTKEYSPEEIAEATRARADICKRLSLKLLEVLDSPNKFIKKVYWKEFRHLVKITNFSLPLNKLRALVKRHKERRGEIIQTNNAINDFNNKCFGS